MFHPNLWRYEMRVRISGSKIATKITTKCTLHACYKSDRMVKLHCEDRQNLSTSIVSNVFSSGVSKSAGSLTIYDVRKFFKD